MTISNAAVRTPTVVILSKLFRTAQPAPARVPDGERVYAIGDIHGRIDCLDDLLNRIDADCAQFQGHIRLIFLGDFVDRGPASRSVIDRLMQIATCDVEAAFIMGNHEELLLRSVEGHLDALSVFNRVGGRATALSYGISASDYDDAGLADVGAMLASAIPTDHLSFLRDLVDRVSAGDYRFVHAGVRPRVSFERQQQADLRWIREPFLSYRGRHDGVVVHGHSVTTDVSDLDNRIAIDTGAWSSGVLSALALENDRRWYLQTKLSVNG